jgi:GntR family transcriptional regulator
MMNPSTIDFSSRVPYYLQLIDLLKASVLQHVWKPGDQLPGEEELCTRYGISRTVVRQALQELEQDGIIIRRKGKGTFVAEAKITEGLAQKLTGFYSDMLERGLQPTTRVLTQQVRPANERVAHFLEVAPGTPVVEMQRLRFINQEPIQMVTTYIPQSICPRLADVDLTNRSLYEFLEKECGLFIARGRRFIEASTATEAESRLLEIKRGAAVLTLDSISFLEDGTPIEFYHAIHRADRSRFEVELVRARSSDHDLQSLVANLDHLPSGVGVISSPVQEQEQNHDHS